MDRVFSMINEIDREINHKPGHMRRYMDIILAVNPARSPFMVSIRQGMALMIPVMMVGAFAVFFNNLPIPAYQEFMVWLFGPGWGLFGTYVHRGTFAIMALGMLLTISYSIARNSPQARLHEVNPMIAVIVSLASLFAFLNLQNGYLRMDWLGPLGVFLAILISALSAQLFIYLASQPLLQIRVFSNAADPLMSQAISAVVPGFLTVSVFALVHIYLDINGMTDLHAAVVAGLEALFAGKPASLPTVLAFVALIHVGWFLGIHGNNVLEPVTQSLFVPALAVNQQLAAQGLAPTEIFTKQFFDVFVFLGGSGATLCLIAALLAGTRRSNTRQIAGISTLPSLFNVNEIMVFGVPIVLNIYLLIPFVLLPLVLTLTTYTAMAWGLVPLTTAPVEWTTPIIMGGYWATGSAAGSIMQLFNLAVGILVYWPFVKLNERYLARGQSETLLRLSDEVLARLEKKEVQLLNRRDAGGNLARQLVKDLERDMQQGSLRLEYQPQIDQQGRMFGVETLFRWRHQVYGSIAPPVAIALAEESGLIDRLGLWIVDTACLQWKEWCDAGMDSVSLSINLTPRQLDHEKLPAEVARVLREYRLSPGLIELEITEQTALGGMQRLDRLHELKAMGLKLAIDDFGMGHSSLMYLKDLNLDTIKLDGSLVKGVLNNERCSEIIRSVIQLGDSIGIRIVAEYVETEAQQQALLAMGCHHYQGYLYSPPLPPEQFWQYYCQTAWLPEGSA